MTFRRGDWQVVGKAEGRGTVAPGETVEVSFDMRQAHWFDGLSGRSLGAGNPSG